MLPSILAVRKDLPSLNASLCLFVRMFRKGSKGMQLYDEGLQHDLQTKTKSYLVITMRVSDN